MNRLLLIFLLVASISCNRTDLSMLPAYVDDTRQSVQAIIEISAGDHLKTEYNKENKAFEVELIDGVPRSISYLPYPVNYGFIPSTLSDKNSGGDGDPLDVMILSKRIPTGKVLSVIPLAMLRLIDRGEIDDKMLAIPSEEIYRSISCTTFECVQENYPSILDALESWFENYKGPGITESHGWIKSDSTMHIVDEAVKSYLKK